MESKPGKPIKQRIKWREIGVVSGLALSEVVLMIGGSANLGSVTGWAFAALCFVGANTILAYVSMAVAE